MYLNDWVTCRLWVVWRLVWLAEHMFYQRLINKEQTRENEELKPNEKQRVLVKALYTWSCRLAFASDLTDPKYFEFMQCSQDGQVFHLKCSESLTGLFAGVDVWLLAADLLTPALHDSENTAFCSGWSLHKLSLDLVPHSYLKIRMAPVDWCIWMCGPKLLELSEKD